MQTRLTTPPLISVLTPTYNRAHLVGRAIRSALAQTFPDFELIVVDDGSRDETVQVVEGFQDPRIRLVRLAENSGMNRAQNKGIQAARGELVAFLDSDDEWLPQKLELQVARLRESDDPQTTVVYCRCYKYDDVTHKTRLRGGELHEGDVFNQLLWGWHPRTPSLLIVKRSSLLGVGGFDERLLSSGDYDLWLRLAEASNHFVAVQEALVFKHENSGPQLSTDPVAKLQAARMLDRRWGPVVKDRFGPAVYRRWKARRYMIVQRAQFVQLRRVAAQGDRLAAWRYCLAMCRFLPRSRQDIIKAFILATLGHNLYGGLARAKEAFVERVGGPPPLAG